MLTTLVKENAQFSTVIAMLIQTIMIMAMTATSMNKFMLRNRATVRETNQFKLRTEVTENTHNSNNS